MKVLGSQALYDTTMALDKGFKLELNSESLVVSLL